MKERERARGETVNRSEREGEKGRKENIAYDEI